MKTNQLFFLQLNRTSQLFLQLNRNVCDVTARLYSLCQAVFNGFTTLFILLVSRFALVRCWVMASCAELPPFGMIELPVGHPQRDACDIEADKQGWLYGVHLPNMTPHTPHYPLCSSLCFCPPRVLSGGVWESKCASLPTYIIWRAVRRCTSCFCTQTFPALQTRPLLLLFLPGVLLLPFSPHSPREPYDPR